LCREVSTPEGLRVCADTGEVLGAEMEPAERVFDGELPRYAPSNPSVHSLLEPVALEWRRDGRPRGFGAGGAVAAEASRARRGLRGRLAGSEAAIRAFKLLRHLAGVLGVPGAAADDASAILRRILSGGRRELLSSPECAVAGALVAAMEARGFHYSPSEVAEAAGAGWKCVADAARRIELRLWAPRRDRALTLRERVAGHVSRLASRLGLGRGVAELAMKIYDEHVRARGTPPPGLPENTARILVHVAAKILDPGRAGRRRGANRAYKAVVEGLTIVVRA
jgi:transcription initiation factor TFIIIB Brf1 subunit/transcription initiation factor TFIIB